MAYYIDLSGLGTGHLGTELDPFSFVDWQTFLGTAPENSEYYIKGQIETTEQVDFKKSNNNQSYFPWGRDPWRIRTSANSYNWYTAILRGGIISFSAANFEGGSNSYAELYNMYIEVDNFNLTPNIHLYVGYFNVIKGCTFVAKNAGLWAGGYDSNAVIQDSVFYTNRTITLGAGSESSRLTINKCAIFYPIPDTSTYCRYTTYNDCMLSTLYSTDNLQNLDNVYNNCTTGFEVGTLPTWNASKENFKFDVLFPNMSQPPKKGTEPFEGYETDLWRNPRRNLKYSIGAANLEYEPSHTNPMRPGKNYNGVTIAGEGEEDLIVAPLRKLYTNGLGFPNKKW